jgi:hypothetical protein
MGVRCVTYVETAANTAEVAAPRPQAPTTTRSAVLASWRSASDGRIAPRFLTMSRLANDACIRDPQP